MSYYDYKKSQEIAIERYNAPGGLVGAELEKLDYYGEGIS